MTFARFRMGPVRRALTWALVATQCSLTLPQNAWAQPAAPQSPPAASEGLRLPALGESASNEFSLSQEKRVGDQIMREIRRDPDYLDDPPLLEYLQSLWQPLVQQARARGDIGPDTAALFPYEAFLVRDRSVNAFALPGGYVGVHLGLIAMTSSPDELASVLAHELAHVTQRHIARSVSAQSRSGALGLAAMLLGLLVASRTGNPDVAQAAVMGGQAAAVQSQLNFSRDMEREADRQGFDLMAGAGFATAGMVSMFDKLDQNNRLNDGGAFPYLRSHPLTVDRIGEARQRVESHGAFAALPPAPLRHSLMQGRARVLMDSSVVSLRRLQGLDARGEREDLATSERVAAHAVAALASTQLRDFARAKASAQAINGLMATQPAAIDPSARQSLLQLLAQLALARGEATAPARHSTPCRTIARGRAFCCGGRQALADGHPEALRRGTENLQTWLADHRQDPSAWELLAQLQERRGQSLHAVRAHAEAQAALGNLAGAIDRLRAGQQLARQSGAQPDFIELSVIDARLRDMQAQRRALLSEQRPQRGPRGDGPPED